MTPLTRADWLAARRRGIGSSDAAAVCGLARPGRGTALEVYEDKLGLLHKEMTPEMEWGLRLEAPIAGAYEQMTGRVAVKPSAPLYVHPAYPWMICTPDRFAEGKDEPRFLLELKTANTFARDDWGDPGTDSIPIEYLVQVQHQMLVTGLRRCDVAVLIGGNDFRIYTVDFHPALGEEIIAREAAFWQLVESETPPEPDWRDPNTVHLLELLHRPEPGTAKPLGDVAQVLADEYEEFGRRERQAAEARQLAKGRLVALLGSAERGLLPDGREVRRKAVRRKAFSVEEKSYFDFRIGKGRREAALES